MGWHQGDGPIDTEEEKNSCLIPPPEVHVEWDEATCGQLVYLYNEAQENFGGRTEEFFASMARPDKVLAAGEQPGKTLKIASIDIGGESNSTTAQIRAQRWLQSLLELQQSAGNSFEFIESVKSDLFPDEIYVFTPEGRIVELPAGATPVDFAYAVHTDIGHACVGARVDRQPHPLSQPLSSGQTIEIITAPGARPNAAWLNFVVSSRARAKIRQMLKNLKRDDSVSLGRRLLNHALGSSRKLAELPPENIKKELERMKLNAIDDLLAEIGLGNAMSLVVAKNLMGDQSSMATSSARNLPIKGADGVLITFAKCCRPIPGDPIIAHVSPGKGLVVHHESCRNIRGYQKEPEKFMAVEWDDKETEQEFIAEIKVDMFNHQGGLANLTAAINAAQSNIQSLSSEEKDGRVYSAFIRLTTRDRVHLANIMRKIRIMPDVIKVTRNRN